MQEYSKKFYLPSFLAANHITACLLFVVIWFAVLPPAQAQTREHGINTNGWYMLFGNHRLTDKWGLHTEYQWRRNDIISNWQQSLLRVGIDYRINNNVMLTVGYGSIITYPYGEMPTLATFHENRIWQNLLITQKIGRFSLAHRYRPEQRFVEHYTKNDNNEIVQDKTVYSNRVRYLFSVSCPLNKPEISPNTWFVRLYEEAFVSFGKNVGKNIFDQNRAYAALGYQINKQANVQVGYMHQLIFKPDGIRLENNHTLQVGLTYNVDLRKQAAH